MSQTETTLAPCSVTAWYAALGFFQPDTEWSAESEQYEAEA
jgi:hypothetical protein